MRGIGGDVSTTVRTRAHRARPIVIVDLSGSSVRSDAGGSIPTRLFERSFDVPRGEVHTTRCGADSSDVIGVVTGVSLDALSHRHFVRCCH